MLTDWSIAPILDVIQRIVQMNGGIAQFWSNTQGWAPLEAAQLLSKSRLDRQVSLSRTLSLWVPPATDAAAPDADGRLILGWTNVGSLVEGSLKWFLSVHYKQYRQAINALRKKHNKMIEPDGVTLGSLRKFFNDSVWTPSDSWDQWISNVQYRRNAIHSYKDRNIGTFDDLERGIHTYWRFLNDLDGRVPYPDDYYLPHPPLT